MKPPVEFNDWTDYRQRMNRLLKIDLQRTVVLTIDMQREYLDLEIGGSPLAADDCKRVLEHTKALLDLSRRCALPIIHVYVRRRQIEVEHGLNGGAAYSLSQKSGLPQNLNTRSAGAPDRIEGSAQAEVPSSLVHPSDLHVTTKKMLDGFLGTELDLLLSQVFHPTAVITVGVNTDTCVLSTALSASNRGYRAIVVSDCVASMRGKDQHWMALEVMSRSFAWVLTLQEVKDKLSQNSVRRTGIGADSIGAS